MMAVDFDDFGGDPEPSNVIPFPAMRANAKLSELWAKAVEQRNRKTQKRHQLRSPADVVDNLIKMRGMPVQPWPASWTEINRRCRTYVGECNAFVGAIGAGKTQWAVQAALAVSGAGLPVLWANLELGGEQLVARILGNMNGEHAMHVLDNWEERRIRHQISAVTDMWHFVDRYDDTDEQIAAVGDAIDLVWEVYRLPCLFVIDHMGQLMTGAKASEAGGRLEMLRVGKAFEKMALDKKAWGLLLAQGTKAGQQVLTGQVEVENAADAIGAAAESSIMQQVASNVIVNQLYKEDDASMLEGRHLAAKCRWTGLEGQIGVSYSKPGGVWSELGHLPPTPQAVKAAEAAEKKDQHRTHPPRTAEEIRREMSATGADNAFAKGKAALLKMITARGEFGLEQFAMLNVPGLRGAQVHKALQELEAGRVIERANGGRWRVLR